MPATSSSTPRSTTRGGLQAPARAHALPSEETPLAKGNGRAKTLWRLLRPRQRESLAVSLRADVFRCLFLLGRSLAVSFFSDTDRNERQQRRADREGTPFAASPSRCPPTFLPLLFDPWTRWCSPSLACLQRNSLGLSPVARASADSFPSISVTCSSVSNLDLSSQVSGVSRSRDPSLPPLPLFHLSLPSLSQPTPSRCRSLAARRLQCSGQASLSSPCPVTASPPASPRGCSPVPAAGWPATPSPAPPPSTAGSLSSSAAEAAAGGARRAPLWSGAATTRRHVHPPHPHPLPLLRKPGCALCSQSQWCALEQV